MSADVTQRALAKGTAGERLNRKEARSLIRLVSPHGVHRLGDAARTNRIRRHGRRATFVCNLQINPSNICSMRCTFCNYAATPRADHAYVLDEADIFNDIDTARPTEVHIVGGLNRFWPYERNLDLVRAIRRRYPQMHIKAFTAVEIDYFARMSGQSTGRIIDELKDAGMNAMPGGGAEIFSDHLYKKHWKNKIGPDQWLAIHREAHERGVSTNATMLFGFEETWDERISHLLTLRDAQDRSGGFDCFIPLPFQPGSDAPAGSGVSPMDILAVLAVSRLVLDNIPHLKAYWPMTGLETAAAGLSWGADDLDGTIQKERIAHLAGARTPSGLARSQMVATITEGGFDPMERNGRFEAVGGNAAADDLSGKGDD